jgi:heat shock protein HtpX
MQRSTRTTFHGLIAANKRNSVLLVIIFCLFVTAVTFMVGLAILGLFNAEILTRLSWFTALAIGLGIAGICTLLSALAYYRGDRMVIGVSHARPIAHEDDPVLYNVVEEMSLAAGTPMPRVYVIDDSAPNAFATGRDPEHAALVITIGLRGKLTRDELQGVVAHEMSHIRNFDIRLMLLLAVLVGTVVMLADLFWQILRITNISGGRRRGRGGLDGGTFSLPLLVLALLLGLLAPFLAQLIQLAVSREREYLADASAVELTRYPLGLASALRKISADPDVLEAANRGTAHLYIVNPIERFAARSRSVFASHPPIDERIRRLEALVG